MPSRVIIGVVVSLLVTSWSLIALNTTESSLDTDPFVQRLVLGGMGFVFLAIGVAIYSRVPKVTVFLFWLYCAFSCMHWGGVIGDGTTHFGLVLLATYVLFASACPQSIFLHLAISYPKQATSNRQYLTLIYAPVILGFVLLGFAIANAVSFEAILLLVSVSVIYSVLGGIVWIYKFTVGVNFPLATRATLVLTFLAGWLPHIGMNAGLYDLGAYEVIALLPITAIPLAMGWVYLRFPASD